MRTSTVDGSATAGRRLPARIDRLWRLVATGLSFALFGLGGVLLSILVVPPVWLLVHPAARRARVGRWLISRSFAIFVWIMNTLGVLRYRVVGVEHAQGTGACLIVANHPSLIDVVFILAFFRNADCVVKNAHWTNPFTMGPIRTAGYISNRDPMEVMEECIRRLRGGGRVTMFPEGTRTAPGCRPVFPRGAASIAARAGVPVLPVRIRCTPSTLTKAERWFDIPAQRVLFELKILPPVDSQAFIERAGGERQGSMALNRHLVDLLCEPLDKTGKSVTLSGHGNALT